MKHKDNKSIISYLITGITITTIVSFLGVTFAFFALFIQDTTTNINGTAAPAINNLVLDTQNDGYIIAENLYPITVAEINTLATTAQFSVFNVATTSTSYRMFLQVINLSDALKVADLKWSLVGTVNGAQISSTSGNFSAIGSATTYNLLTSVPIAGRVIQNYVLKIWLEDNGGDQNSLMNSTFSFKVAIE